MEGVVATPTQPVDGQLDSLERFSAGFANQALDIFQATHPGDRSQYQLHHKAELAFGIVEHEYCVKYHLERIDFVVRSLDNTPSSPSRSPHSLQDQSLDDTPDQLPSETDKLVGKHLDPIVKIIMHETLSSLHSAWEQKLPGGSMVDYNRYYTEIHMALSQLVAEVTNCGRRYLKEREDVFQVSATLEEYARRRQSRRSKTETMAESFTKQLHTQNAKPTCDGIFNAFRELCQLGSGTRTPSSRPDSTQLKRWNVEAAHFFDAEIFHGSKLGNSDPESWSTLRSQFFDSLHTFFSGKQRATELTAPDQKRQREMD